jgi:hypothetical protein
MPSEINTGCWCSTVGYCKEYLDLRGRKLQEDGENCIMFTILAPRKIFFLDNPIRGYEMGRTHSVHAWDRPEVHEQFSLEHPEERDH